MTTAHDASAESMSMRTATPGRFDYVIDWPQVTAPAGAAIKAFWRSEGALADETAMDARLGQVVMHACDASGAVAGVCTALAVTPPPQISQADQPDLRQSRAGRSWWMKAAYRAWLLSSYE